MFFKASEIGSGSDSLLNSSWASKVASPPPALGSARLTVPPGLPPPPSRSGPGLGTACQPDRLLGIGCQRNRDSHLYTLSASWQPSLQADRYDGPKVLFTIRHPRLARVPPPLPILCFPPRLTHSTWVFRRNGAGLCPPIVNSLHCSDCKII